MKILITGICGFVGTSLAEHLLQMRPGLSICGIDNLMRPGSERNRLALRKLGVDFIHGDIRQASDVDSLPKADWLIDAAANPSVLAGLSGDAGSRQLLEHNFSSAVNVLEYSKRHAAGLVLLSSSRVYSIAELLALPLRISNNAFELDDSLPIPPGVSRRGLNVSFSTRAPISLYGSTKLAVETLAMEYGEAFQFPVWINRCGVLAGAGQFGTPEQGIVSYWLNAHLRRRPLRYIGFDGVGIQTRDVFHPRDLAALICAQMDSTRTGGQRIYNAGGGSQSAISLANLNAWCDKRFGRRTPEPDLRPRPYDIPWIVMDSEDAQRDFGWHLEVSLDCLLREIAAHAECHPEWLEISGV